MSIHHESHKGFTAVELLIALFIAAAFMLVGYQLYTVVIRDAASVRNRAKASTIANDYVNREAASVSTCSEAPVTASETPPTNSGLPDIAISSIISAPHGCGGSGEVIKVQIDVSYGPTSKRERVSNAVYVTL